MKIKNKIIKKLGGYTKEEFNRMNYDSTNKYIIDTTTGKIDTVKVTHSTRNALIPYDILPDYVKDTIHEQVAVEVAKHIKDYILYEFNGNEIVVQVKLVKWGD